MIWFLLQLLCLSALTYCVLDSEFKRLKRKYAFRRLLSDTVLTQFKAFSDRMMVFGVSAKQATKSFHALGAAMDVNTVYGSSVYIPRGARIQHVSFVSHPFHGPWSYADGICRGCGVCLKPHAKEYDYES